MAKKETSPELTEEFKKRIFEPFSQEGKDARSVYQGTGLGMAISRNIARMMNGDIVVESKLGVGSKFTVTIFYIFLYSTHTWYARFKILRSRANFLHTSRRTLLSSFSYPRYRPRRRTEQTQCPIPFLPL